MSNDIMKHKPYWNASKRRTTSILDILVSQKRLHKPKTSTIMLWIGCDRGDGRRRRKNCSVAALSNSIFITNTFISSLMILLHILQPSVVALQNHNSESLLQSSTLIYQTNNSSSDSNIPNYILRDDRKDKSRSKNEDIKDATACLTRVSAVVEANSPELLVLPNEEELSAFTTSRLHIKVAWSHIDALLTANGDKWCVGSYLIEYGPYKYERHKRESESSSAEVSPALGRDKTEYTLILDDNCIVYSVHLVVIPAVVVKKPSKLNDLITSGRRKFWPAAYRTVLDVYSDSAVVSWPPSCSYMTNEWNLEACPIVTSNNFKPSEDSNGVQVKPEYSCVHVDLTSESTVHVANLLPCKFYQFRLKAFGDLLWTFAPSRTLPTPQVDSKSFTNAIHLTINQNGDCDVKALVHHWRVQYCEHEDDEHDNEIFLDTENNSENDRLKRKASNKRHLIDTEGSGLAISDDEDNKIGGMEYYEEIDTLYSESEDSISNQKPSSSNCESILYDISSSKGKIKIKNLKECTLYTVDVSPVDANGHSIRPSEQFGSVHSTLCPGNDDDQESNSFWFGEENSSDKDGQQGSKNHLEKGEETNTQLVPMSEQHEDDSMPLSILSLTVLILISVALFLALGLIILYKIKRKRYLFKTSNSCDGHQPMSLVSSSSSKFHRVLNRVGKPFNDGKNYHDEDPHLSSSNAKANIKGHQDPNKKCQKVLIATSGKNGVVENKSICSSKINNSKSSNSLTYSNITTTEEDGDVSPKSVLLNFN